MDEEMRMRQSKWENPPNELLGRKCSPLGTSAEVASFSQGFLLSLGTSAELHLCQLDVSYDIGICRERTHRGMVVTQLPVADRQNAPSSLGHHRGAAPVGRGTEPNPEPLVLESVV